MSLSAKFAQLKKVSAPSNNNVSRPRVQNNVAAQQSKRAAQNQSRRTGAPVQAVKNNNNNRPKSANKPARGGKVILNGVKKNLRKNAPKGGKRGAGGRKGGKGEKAGEKKVKATSDDLDADMANYWYKAGKGPNPEVEKLDREMEEYRNAAKAAPAAVAEPAAVTMSE